MKSTSIFFASSLVAAAALIVACGSSDSTPTTTSTGATSGGTTGGAPTLTCADYCAEDLANCTGANAQYADDTHCEAVCKSFPAGALSDTTGDTLGCRIYHGGAAKTDPTTHCGHSGPGGGDLDPTATTFPACGDGCEAFCNLAAVACTGANQQYTDTAACMTECKTFKASTTAFSVADTAGDSFNCRMYHLTAASVDPGTHCPHIKAMSAVCK